MPRKGDTLIDWLTTFAGDTRARLLALLRRSRRSVGELAEALEISGNAVRTHLASLERDGMVEQTAMARSTGGKPARLYEITPHGEELFPKAYATVLDRVFSILEEREGSEALRSLLRDVGANLAPDEARAGDPSDRVGAAAATLRSLGGDVVVERVADGWRMRSSGCPLSGVVKGHPEVCSLTAALVQEIVGLPVSECCERAERSRCGFDIADESPPNPG